MKKITDQHAQLLHDRAVELAGALVDAEIRHENGEMDDASYDIFKHYYYARTHFDKLTALTNIDFQVSQNETHLKSYVLAAQKALPAEQQLDMAALQAKMLEGALFIYAFRFNDYLPVGVVSHIEGEPRIVNWGIIPEVAGQGFEAVLEEAGKICQELELVDHFDYF